MNLFDIAGCALLINHYLKKQHYAEVFCVGKPQNKTMYDHYKSKPYKRFRKCLFAALLAAHRFDVIHIHSVEFVIPLFKLLRKKVILHYHGSDLMGQKQTIFKKACQKMADAIIYNSPDMSDRLVKSSYFIPDFIDTELFKPEKSGAGAVTILSNHLDKDQTKKLLLPNITIYDLDVMPRIDYVDMPQFLNRYEIYQDDKITDYGLYCTALSNTGMQALACGKMVKHDGNIIHNLPIERTPEHYVKKLEKIYRDVC